MSAHSIPIIPRGSFQVACEKIGGSFGIGDRVQASCPFLSLCVLDISRYKLAMMLA